MATQKLIQLFEDVLKVNEEGSHTKQQKAKRNANWFYEKCKDCPDEVACGLNRVFLQIRDQTLKLMLEKTVSDIL